MRPKTITTLKELRIGDSFVFTRGDRKTPWRVTARADKSHRVSINMWDDRGTWMHPYDDLKKGDTKVMFLRHTIPVVGEECFIEDLKEGDVFCRPEDIVHEYILVKRGIHFCDVRRVDEAAPVKAGRVARVIFIRPKSDI
jgi:hypothetical protein